MKNYILKRVLISVFTLLAIVGSPLAHLVIIRFNNQSHNDIVCFLCLVYANLIAFAGCKVTAFF